MLHRWRATGVVCCTDDVLHVLCAAQVACCTCINYKVISLFGACWSDKDRVLCERQYRHRQDCVLIERQYWHRQDYVLRQSQYRHGQDYVLRERQYRNRQDYVLRERQRRYSKSDWQLLSLSPARSRLTLFHAHRLQMTL